MKRDMHSTHRLEHMKQTSPNLIKCLKRTRLSYLSAGVHVLVTPSTCVKLSKSILFVLDQLLYVKNIK